MFKPPRRSTEKVNSASHVRTFIHIVKVINKSLKQFYVGHYMSTQLHNVIEAASSEGLLKMESHDIYATFFSIGRWI